MIIKLDVNKWIIKELEETSKSINDNIEKYLFHEVANRLYHFIWHTFCDWYIEFVKSNFNNKSQVEETQKVAGWVFGEILKLIHPIMPFLSEKLWHDLFDKNNFLMMQNYNSYEYDESFNNSKNNIKKIIEIIIKIRNLRSELNIPYKNSINLFIDVKNTELIEFIKSFDNELKRLLKINDIKFGKIKNQKNTAFIVLTEFSLLIPLEGIVNTTQELLKLNKKRDLEILKLESLKSKLNNKDFIEKAPNNVIDNFKKQEHDVKSSIEKIDQIINTIN